MKIRTRDCWGNINLIGKMKKGKRPGRPCRNKCMDSGWVLWIAYITKNNKPGKQGSRWALSLLIFNGGRKCSFAPSLLAELWKQFVSSYNWAISLWKEPDSLDRSHQQTLNVFFPWALSGSACGQPLSFQFLCSPCFVLLEARSPSWLHNIVKYSL